MAVILGHVHPKQIMMPASATDVELIVTKWVGDLLSLVAILFTTVTLMMVYHTVNKFKRINTNFDFYSNFHSIINTETNRHSWHNTKPKDWYC